MHSKVEPAVTKGSASGQFSPSDRTTFLSRRRAHTLLLALSLSLGLGACHSGLERADAWEGKYDRLMIAQAYPAALSAIQKSISYDDTSSRRYIKLAELQMRMGQVAGAASSFQAAVDLEPSNVEALENLSILAVRSGQFEAAQRYIDPLLALNPNDPAGLLASGAIALGQRRFKDAAALADRITAILPNRPDSYVLKARALDGLGKTSEAIALLDQHAATADDPREYLSQMMTFYRRIGDMNGIRAVAIRMMPLFPNDVRYAIEAARAYSAAGKQDKVREIIDGLLQRFPGDANTLVAIGDFWRDTQPINVARARTLELAKNASSPRVRSALADQLIDMGDPANALDLLASMAPADVNSGNIDAQTHFARASLAVGQTAQAQAKSSAILKFDPSNPAALLVRARLKLLAKDYQGAFTDAQLVANDDDNNEEAALLVAQIYAAQGNAVLAAGAFGTARQKFPDSPDVRKAEIDWLLSQNRMEEAAQRAVSFYHDHPRSGPAKTLVVAVCTKTHAMACGSGKPIVAKMLAL